VNTLTETQVRLFASAQSWIEGETVRQLYATAKLEGVRLAVGFPDLHPGKGKPVGAAFVTEGAIYPHLIGGHIGCGMPLFKPDLVHRDLKLDRWAKLPFNLEHPWDQFVSDFLAGHELESTEFDSVLVASSQHSAQKCFEPASSRCGSSPRRSCGRAGSAPENGRSPFPNSQVMRVGSNPICSSRQRDQRASAA
jgi:RNA-splicing ligase RtcB